MRGAGRATRIASTERASRATMLSPQRAASPDRRRWRGCRRARSPGDAPRRSRGRAGGDVASRRPAQPQERGERRTQAEREQDDAGDAQRARREEPDAEPREGDKQDRHREPPDDRRPGAFDERARARPPSTARPACRPPVRAWLRFVVSSPRSVSIASDQDSQASRQPRRKCVEGDQFLEAAARPDRRRSPTP